jgi:predicted enzyme involved in methoxymalonyl-ACP biosynthesis
VLAAARERGLREIVGLYRPTDRNGMVRDHYAGLGFTRDGTEGPADRWVRRVAGAQALDTFILTE